MSVANPNGHIKVYRQIENSQVWRNAELLKVWLWCLLRASWTERWVDAKTGKGTTEVHLLPGQFIFGRFEAAAALQMKPSSVRNRMDKLAKIGNLVLKVDTHWTIVTVCNWAIYQAKPGASGQPLGQATDTQRTSNGHPTDTNKNGKKEEEGKEGEETDFPTPSVGAAPDGTPEAKTAPSAEPSPKAKKKPKPKAEPKPPAPYRQLTDYWCDKWEEVHHNKYPFRPRDGKAMSEIWEYAEHDFDRGCDVLDNYLACGDKFYAGHPLAKLASDLPKFAADTDNNIFKPRELTEADEAICREIRDNLTPEDFKHLAFPDDASKAMIHAEIMERERLKAEAANE